MKKLISIVFVCFALGAFAQNTAKKELRPKKEQRNKLDSIRVAYINSNLPLSAEEQTKFWPVYDEMKTKMRELNKKEMQARSNVKNNLETMSEADLKTQVESMQALEQEKLTLKKEYSSKIASIITWKKSVKLVMIEKQFKEQLRDEIKRRRSENGSPNLQEMN